MNPYESTPAPAELGNPSGRPVIRHVFFIVNLLVAILMLISAAISIAMMESPGSFFGGILGFLPFLIYGTLEWLAWSRNRSSMERKLAYANLVCAALAAFGVATNIGEALMDSEPINWRFLIVFSLIGSCIIAYLIACGWLRLWWTRST